MTSASVWLPRLKISRLLEKGRQSGAIRADQLAL